jgi:hypothetical protein
VWRERAGKARENLPPEKKGEITMRRTTDFLRVLKLDPNANALLLAQR